MAWGENLLFISCIMFISGSFFKSIEEEVIHVSVSFWLGPGELKFKFV